MIKHRANLPDLPKVRCAIYTRKSVTEGLEQEFNSLDAQRESAEAYIRSQAGEGWTLVPEHYSDGGFTGGNIERPGVQSLLAAVKRGEIDCIVVYKVDRLSRSLLDFARIMDVLEQHNCSFVSVTQQFNTTNSMGRLTLNILLSFAQFEREIISERTRDKVIAARKKGKWTGGYPVLGYDIAKDKRLIINRDEASIVRELFELYLRHEATLPVVEECRNNDWRTKSWISKAGKRMGGQLLNKTRVYSILTNPLYTGKVRVGDSTTDGEHDAIIDEDTFEQVRMTLKRNCNNGGVKVRNRHGALLKGLLFDAKTGYAMGHSFTKKGNKLYRYYVNTMAGKEGWDSCSTTSLPANEVEAFVVDTIRSMGQDAKLQQSVVDEVMRDARERSAKLESERKSTFRKLEELSFEIKAAVQDDDGVRLRNLREQSGAAEEKLNRIIEDARRLEAERFNENEIREAMADFDPCWNQMVPREKTRLLELIIEKILVDSEAGKLAVQFRPSGIKALIQGGKA